jgi:hypothetical protein
MARMESEDLEMVESAAASVGAVLAQSEEVHRCLTHAQMLCGFGRDYSDWTPVVVPNPPVEAPMPWEAAPEYIGVKKDGSWMVVKYRSHPGRFVSTVLARGMLRADAEMVAGLMNGQR